MIAMREVELRTRDDEFVAVVDILPYLDHGMPDVIAWGSRLFYSRTLKGFVVTPPHRWVYLEAFAVTSFTTSPGRPLDAKVQSAPPVDMDARTTLHGTPIGQHLEIDPATGMQKDYIVLTAEERAKGFVRPVRRSYTHTKCGESTRMGVALCETYARAPGFYSGTYCATCHDHFPIGPDGEFSWDEDGEKVGT